MTCEPLIDTADAAVPFTSNALDSGTAVLSSALSNVSTTVEPSAAPDESMGAAVEGSTMR